MKPNEACALERAWGEKPCDHPDIIAECGGGEDDVWRCTQCGRICDYDEWMKLSGLPE